MPTPESIARQALTVIAMSYAGQDVHEQVWLDVLDPPQANPTQRLPDGRIVPLSWCRAFVLYCIRTLRREAGLPVDGLLWLPGRGFEEPHGLRIRRLPEVGDEAYRNRGQHGAVVTRVHGDGTIDTCDGNSYSKATGKSGIVVMHERTPISEWDAYFDLGPLLS